MAEWTMVEALNAALVDGMLENESVACIGEDIGAYGGAFGVTAGLLKRFGRERVIETPIAESAVIGGAIGMALMGCPAVAELQFIDFLSCAGFDQLVSVAAKMRYRTGAHCPIVVRGPCGAGVSGGPFHSASPEMWALSTPGLKVLMPSDANDAYGLLRAAILDPDPILFLEHKFLYRRFKVEIHKEILSLGKAKLKRAGEDGTLVTYGAMVHRALEAAEILAQDGYQLRVLDLRSLWPLDEEALRSAARETHRLMFIHEAPKMGGFAAQLAAFVGEFEFDWLDAPLMQLCAPNTPVPYAPSLEAGYVVSTEAIVERGRALMAY